jgi:hypothetical protein
MAFKVILKVLMDYTRLFFIVLKSLFMLYKFIYCIVRYKGTYKTYWQFENAIFLSNFILVCLVIEYELTPKHSLYIFFCMFLLSSIQKLASSFHLHLKAQQALFATKHKIW